MAESVVCFGRFRLDLAQRQLLLDGRPLQLGDRALQVLRVLAGAKGALVSKDELMARVWAGQVVEENNLQVQISTLRKALDPEGTGESWIVTVPGRGYRLLGLGDAGSHADRPPAELAPAHHNNLPQLANALIGRERDVAEIEALLSRYRLVTLVGVAGVGKTSLSLQVGADLLARFPGGVWFVELAPLDRAELIGEAVAAVFGLPVQGERPATDAIAAFLRSRRVLLILDNCEHVIAAAAKLADALLKTCPGVCLLATSREALSVAGEHAYRVPLLDVPLRSTSLTAAQAMEHSAVHLFVERAAAALGRFSLTDETAPTVAEICRRLDGIPLAIELAANALMIAGAMRKDVMELQAARALFEEALVLSKALGDVRVQDDCEARFAVIAFQAGQMAEAIDRARRAIEASRRHGTLIAEYMALQWLAGFLILDDQIEPGRVAARSAFELSRALGVDLPGLFYHLALVLAMQGETDSAARLAGFAAGHADQRQFSFYAVGRAIRSRLVERLHCAMSPQECEAAMAAGAAWSEQEAAAVAQAV